MKVVLAALLPLLLLVQPAFAQKKTAFITGKVLDENDHPLAGVSVTILGRQSGIMTSDSGNFRIRVETEPGLGAEFIVELPRATRANSGARADSRAAGEILSPVGPLVGKV